MFIQVVYMPYILSLPLSLFLCRSLSVSLHQQLSQQQRQQSQSEVDRCQLHTHIHTLQQAKQALHGESSSQQIETDRKHCVCTVSILYTIHSMCMCVYVCIFVSGVSLIHNITKS